MYGMRILVETREPPPLTRKIIALYVFTVWITAWSSVYLIFGCAHHGGVQAPCPTPNAVSGTNTGGHGESRCTIGLWGVMDRHHGFGTSGWEKTVTYAEQEAEYYSAKNLRDTCEAQGFDTVWNITYDDHSCVGEQRGEPPDEWRYQCTCETSAFCYKSVP